MKFMKRTCLVGLVMLIIGLIGAIMGYFNDGYNLASVSDRINHLHRVDLTPKNKNINRIQVDSKAPIAIYRGAHFKVIGNVKKSAHTRVTVNHHQLRIKSGPDYNKINFVPLESRIRVEVPNQTKIRQIKQLSNSDGDLHLHNLNVQRLQLLGTDSDHYLNQVRAASFHLSSSNGDSLVNNCQLGNGHFNTVDGDLHLNQDAWNQLIVNSSDGDVHLTNQIINHNSKIAIDDGDVTGRAFSKKIKVSAKSSSGDVTNKHKNNSHYKLLVIKSQDGDINIY